MAKNKNKNKKDMKDKQRKDMNQPNRGTQDQPGMPPDQGRAGGTTEPEDRDEVTPGADFGFEDMDEDDMS